MSTPTTTAPGINSADEYSAWGFEPEQIPAAWDEMEPLVLRGLREGNGEASVEDVLRLLLTGKLAAFATARNGEMEMLLLTEIIQYPQFRTANIFLLAGKNVKQAACFLAAFEEWAIAHGALFIEARCHEAQTRLFRRLGFHTQYRVIRRNLRGSLQS